VRYDSTVSDPESNETIDQAVLGAPLVARLELGSVTLPASEWLQVRVGDVLSTDRKTNRTVAVRVGGTIVAWGELVTVDGTLGVRIQQIAPPAAPASEIP